MAPKRKPNPLVLVVIGVVHVAAAVFTWRNLRSRSDEQVRGRKALWRLASAVNTGGSAAYWLVGRRGRSRT